jgi:signal transduction histidine kinase
MTPRLLQIFGLAMILFFAGMPARADSTKKVLTRAADILSLTAAQAKERISVSITGVVTVAETTPNWKGKFFVQDVTGGVFVNNKESRQPSVGDLVVVNGATHPGGYAPDIVRPQWEKIGTAPLPAAKPVSAEQLMSGTEDGQRVEVSGIVRSAQRVDTKLILELASGGYRFHVFAPGSLNIDPDTLIGATVHVRGTSAATFNAPLRHMLTVAMYVPLPSDFIVDHLPDPAIFSEPFTPLNGIAQYRKNATPDGRIRVKGIVTYQRPGEDIFLHDATGGLQVKCDDTNIYEPGEVVEAVGFPSLERFLPVLQDAILTRTKESREIVRPKEVSFQELSEGMHHADPIILQGRLLDRSIRRVGTPASRINDPKKVLILQNSNFMFTAEAASAKVFADLASIPIGSLLEVSGTCMLQLGEEGKLESVQVLVPSADNVRILAKPDWWTPNRLLAGLAILLAVLLVAVVWSIMIWRKNSALRASVQEKIRVQGELQKAHDLLEWRVQERTKQLKFEMTARKEGEVQFKATLKERTRLAQELHDTLEQSLTGIGLQLDTAGRLFGKETVRATHHVEMARSLMTQSQMELRRSIWDLRSRELEQFDLCRVLLASGQQMLDGTDIQIHVTTEGWIRPLSEVAEENLLRIGQEALTNVVKHSAAKVVNIELVFRAQNVVLIVKDDGRGFSPENSAGAREGHFGLVGMDERAKRLDGKLTIESAPGAGTCVQVEIPINSMPASNGHETIDDSGLI